MEHVRRYQGGSAKRAHPIPQILDLSLDEEREAASLLLNTPGAYAAYETIMGSLVVVWLPASGVPKVLDQQRLAKDESGARA